MNPETDDEFDSTEARIADRAMHYINVRTGVFRVVSTSEAVRMREAIEDAVGEILAEDQS